MNRIGLLVTYRRPRQLATTISALASQSAPLNSLVVIDNDPARSASFVSDSHRYLPTGSNLGPAGALALGIHLLLESADDDDWVVVLDDDDPPAHDDALERIFIACEGAGSDVGGVGAVGARYDRRTGNPVRVSDADLRGMVTVDFIGGGQLPHYRVGALRAIRPDPSLFFGFDDLDLGLRIQEAGFSLQVEANYWLTLRQEAGTLGVGSGDLRRASTSSSWRRYYSSRNLVLLARRFGRKSAAPYQVASHLTRAAVFRGWSLEMRLAAIRGVRDGVLNRRGLTYAPD